MSLALRTPFGAFAGGLEHAQALSTLVHAVQSNGGTMAPLVTLHRPTCEVDRFHRLVALLQHVISNTEYSLDDLRREGFDESVLRALIVQ
jgi:hypothetical protein